MGGADEVPNGENPGVDGVEDGWEVGVKARFGGGAGFGAVAAVSPAFLFTQRLRSGS